MASRLSGDAPRQTGCCCHDNAPTESFFHTLKVKLVHQRRWATRDEARCNLFAYIGRLRHFATRPRGARLHHARAGRAGCKLIPGPQSGKITSMLNQHSRTRHPELLQGMLRPWLATRTTKPSNRTPERLTQDAVEGIKLQSAGMRSTMTKQ